MSLSSAEARCSKQIIIFFPANMRGKAWEIWSRAVMSGTHTVGGAQQRTSRPCLVMSIQRLDVEGSMNTAHCWRRIDVKCLDIP